jgi:hypothetical protein
MTSFRIVWTDLDYYGVDYIIAESVYCAGQCPGSGKKFSWISGYGNPHHSDDLPTFCDTAPKSPLFKLALRTKRNQFSVYHVLNKDGSIRAPFNLKKEKFYQATKPQLTADAAVEEDIDVDAIDEYDI